MNSPQITKCLCLAGEGPNELGSWAKELHYREQGNFQPGILETILIKVRPNGWEIKKPIQWAKIRKYKAGEHRGKEVRNVLGLCLLAKENRCTVVCFSRDIDGNTLRQREIQEAILRAAEIFPTIEMIGGCALPCIEGWVLALLGMQGTEGFSRTRVQDLLFQRHIEPKITSQMVSAIEECGLGNIPEDAAHFRNWLQKAEEIL